MLFHAGSEEMEFPGISMGKYTKDFSWGFYCTNDFEQAKRWAGRISRKAFWALAEFKYPTHQISFHTLKALQCLRFERSEIIDD